MAKTTDDVRYEKGDRTPSVVAYHHREHVKEKMGHIGDKKKAVAKKMSWAESHGQKEGHQLKGTITGKKFGSKSY